MQDDAIPGKRVGFIKGGVAGGGCEVVAFVFSRAGLGVWAAVL